MKNRCSGYAVVLMVLMGMGSAWAQDEGRSISDVAVNEHWIRVFDQSGKKVCELPRAGKEVQGAAGDFFVITTTHWIQTYDMKCKKIREMPLTGKIVRGAGGTRFTVKNGAWIETYDRNCKRISQRPAN